MFLVSNEFLNAFEMVDLLRERFIVNVSEWFASITKLIKSIPWHPKEELAAN